MKMRKSEQTVHSLFTMSTERKLVEFHKAKTILMKPLAYSLINRFFFQKDVAFSQKFYFVQDGFSQARTRGRGNENNPFFFAVCDCTLAYLKH